MKKILHTKLILALIALFCVTTPAWASEYDINSYIGTADSIIGHSPSLINGDVLNIKQDLTATQSIGNLNAALTINGNNGADGNYTINGASTYSGFNVTNNTIFDHLNLRAFKTSGDGGAINANGANVTITNSTFGGVNASDGNSAGDGGAICNTGTMHINNSNFYNNFALYQGGSIYNKPSSNLSITDSLFSGNHVDPSSSYGGGAIYTEYNTTTTITNSTFGGINASDGNTAKYGGAIYSGSILNIFADGSVGSGKTLFENNSASYHGGAIYSYGTLNIASYNNGTVEFTNNTQGEDGSKVNNAIYNDGTINLNAYSWGKIIFNDSIYRGTVNINPTSLSTAYDGTISFVAPVQSANVYFYNGTLDNAHFDNSTFYFKGVNETTVKNSYFTNNSKVCNQDVNIPAYLDNDTFTSNNFTSGYPAIYNYKTMYITGSNFNSNSGSDGGAISNYGTMYINNSNFYDNSSRCDGGSIYNNSDLSITDSLFTGNHVNNTSSSGYDGGAIYNSYSATLNITNSTFGGVNVSDGNAARLGGAIFNNKNLNIYADGSVSSGKTLFENNTASVYGGAIYNCGTLNIAAYNGGKIQFSNNTSTQNGGAIYNGSSLNIAAYNNGTVEFTGNTQGPEGSTVSNAIYNSSPFNLNAYSGGKIIFNDSIYGGGLNINNPSISTAYDGSIFFNAPVQNALVNFYNGTIKISLENNSSLYFKGVNETHLIDSIITNNSKVLNQDVNIPAYLDNVTFASNVFSYDHALYNQKTMYVTGSTFSNNSCNFGGAISNNGTIYINNSDFYNNSVTRDYGGGIYNNSNLSITDSLFSGNHSDVNSSYGGGAIYNGYGNLNIGNTAFIKNTASLGYGGAIVGYNGTTTITNSIFGGVNASDANSANYGGAISTDTYGNLNIYADGSVASGKTLFQNNTAISNGGAIYNNSSSGNINIAAYKGGTVEFTGNTQGADGAKVSNAIYNKSGTVVNLNADTSSKILFNDKNDGGTFNINRSDLKFADNSTVPYSGNIKFNENLSNATLSVKNGMLTLGEWNNTKLTNAAGTASSNEYFTNVALTLSGGVLNLANNNAQDTLNLSSFTSTSSAYLLFDADLANSKNDCITTASASGPLNIGGVHMLSDGTNSKLTLFTGEKSPTLNSFNTYTNNHQYTFTPDATAGVFDITRTEVDGLAQAISDSSNSRSFSAIENVIPTSNLGTMAGTKLYLYGNENNITANNTSGLTIGSGQSLNIQNIGTVSGFSDYFFSNAGTVNIDANGSNTTLSSGINLDGGTVNVTTENSASVNFSDITATSGTINVNGNANFNGNVSNVALNINSGTSNVSNANFANTDIAFVGSTMNLSADNTSNTIDSSSSLSFNNSKLNVNTENSGSVAFDTAITSNNITNALNINSDSVLNNGNVIFNNTVNDLTMNLYGGTLTFGATGSTLTSKYTNNVNLNLQAGKLNLENGLVTDVLNVKDFTATSNASLQFDANLATGKNDTINVSGTASGTVNIFHINILADSALKSSTLTLFTGSGDLSHLILSAFNVYSDKYMYEFSQDSTHIGTYDYNKTSRGSLNAAVEDESAYRVFSAPANTNAWYDLGNMAGANSTLDIFANGHSINGAGYAGINVASGQTLNIDGASSWNGFVSTSNGGAINNAGTLNVTGSTITNNSAVNGGAIYNNGIATLVNTSLTNNNATTKGGAIYNTGTVNIIADGSNVSISGNTTGTLTKTSNAIYLETGSHLNLNAGSSNSITIGDKITTNSTTPAEININKTGVKETSSVDAPTNGTVNINNNFSGNINLYGGTLALGADNYLNNDNLNCYGGNINMINNAVGTMALGTLNLGSATTNLSLDADLANSKIDTITANSVSATTGKLNINNIHMISDAANKTTAIQVADANMRNYITMNVNNVSGPIYKYDVAYDASSGSASFVSNKQAFSPTIMATPVSAAAGTFLNQLNVYSETLGRAEVYMSIPQNDRLLMHYINRTASIEESPKVFSPLYTPEERGGAWFKQYTTFENIPLNNGPNVSNVGYGAIFGVDSPMQRLKRGYDGYVTAFAGYNGSHQNYDNIGVYQNGGNLGLTGVVYKGNFFAALSGSVGASNGNANTPYGVDNFTTLIAGLAGKVGYNIEINRGRFILQPTYSMSYTFSNTFDYTTAAGTNVKSDPLNAIQISPGLKFIANLKNGWQPYLAVDMVWNLMDSQKFYANDVQIPSVSVAPYFEYGLGVQRRWGERFSGYAQTMFRGGGRNGIALQFGFRWAFGQ